MKKYLLVFACVSVMAKSHAQEETTKPDSKWNFGLGIEQVFGSWNNSCLNANFIGIKENHFISAGFKIPVSFDGFESPGRPYIGLEASYKFSIFNDVRLSPYFMGGVEYMYVNRKSTVYANVQSENSSAVVAVQNWNKVFAFVGGGLKFKAAKGLCLTADASYLYGIAVDSHEYRDIDSGETLQKTKSFFYQRPGQTPGWVPFRGTIGVSYVFGKK